MKFLIDSKAYNYWRFERRNTRNKKANRSIKTIKQENEQIRNIIQYKQENFVETSNNQDLGIIIHDKQIPIESFINTISKIYFQRWYTNVKVIIEDFEVEMTTLIDLGANMNCSKKWLNPTQ